jgi:small subunit ribosomal protein S17
MNEQNVANQVDDISSIRTVIGTVVSNKMDKTAVVMVMRKIRHPKYGKYIKRKTKLFAHDENNTCKEGDTVLIKQSRPLSKKKHWVLVEVIEQT